MNCAGINFDTFMNRFRCAEISLMILSPVSRSGSYFVQSLFDGHPQIFSISFTEQLLSILLQKPEAIKNSINELFQHGQQLSHNLNGIEDADAVRSQLNQVDWAKELQALVPDLNPFDSLAAIHYLVAQKLNVDLSRIKFLLIHEHFLATCPKNYLEQIERTFPNAVLLWAARDIRGCYVSLKQIDYFNGSWIYLNFHEIFRVGLYSQYQTCRYISKTKLRSFIVRLEDLQEHKFESVDHMLQSLGLETSPIAYESTAFGQKWFGDSGPKKAKGGFIKSANQKRWVSGLTPLRGLAIDSIMTAELEAFEYAPYFAKSPLSRFIGRLLAPIVNYDDISRVFKAGFYRCLWRRYEKNAYKVFARWLPGVVANPIRSLKLAWLPRTHKRSQFTFIGIAKSSPTQRAA